jgi:hypothetical protein
MDRPVKPTSSRGSVGTARVWDSATRRRRAAGVDSSPEIAGTLASTSAAEIAALIAGIVQVTLHTQLSGWDGARRAALGTELESRLLAVFGIPGQNGLGSHALAEPAIEPVEDVLSEPQEPAVPAPADAAEQEASPELIALERTLAERLRRLDSPLLTREDIARLLARLAQGALSTAVSEPAADSEQMDRLDLLQRRAAKLERSLDETRSALAYVSGLEHVDMGLASIYREVQGLSEFDPQHERKRSALEHIFQANLALRNRS